MSADLSLYLEVRGGIQDTASRCWHHCAHLVPKLIALAVHRLTDCSRDRRFFVNGFVNIRNSTARVWLARRSISAIELTNELWLHCTRWYVVA